MSGFEQAYQDEAEDDLYRRELARLDCEDCAGDPDRCICGALAPDDED
jgi:hypothetical protein